MPNALPVVFDIPSRSDLITAHLAARKRRNPDIDVSPGGEPYIDAVVAADTRLAELAAARQVAFGAVVETAEGNAIAQWGFREGVDNGTASASIGFVKIIAGAAGGTIFANDELVGKTNPALGRFACRVTALYRDGDFVPVRSIATGYGSDLPPGTVLQWTAPRPGIGTDAVVTEQEDGIGLVGGHPQPTLAEWKAAIQDKLRHPPGADNDAAVRNAARRHPDFAVQYAFSYPAVLGPGVKVVAFTVPPSRLGGTRIPTGAQLLAMQQYLEFLFGADDGVVAVPLMAQAVPLHLGITWYPRSKTWADAPAPWPQYSDIATVVSAVSATAWRITSMSAPSIGKVVALFDRPNLRFVFKTIATVTFVAGTTYDMTCATQYGASDLAYVPLPGQRLSPWSELLNLLPQGIAEYFETLGPGEQLDPALFALDGLRQRREPPSPAEWPSETTEAGILAAVQDPSVLDKAVLSPVGPVAIGTRGVTSYLATLGDFAVFPKVP